MSFSVEGIDSHYDIDSPDKQKQHAAESDDNVEVKSKKKEGVDKMFLGTLIFLQILCFIFFAGFTKYEDSNDLIGGGTVSNYYAMYQDVHVMIFIGFGLLMTFLKKHAFNSMGMTFLIGVMSIQLGILWVNVFHKVFKGEELMVHLDIPTLIAGDFAAGAVLISYGAMLGRITASQILWMTFFELFFYALNEYIGVELLETVDMGGSMFVHAFGAYFGLAFSWAWGSPAEEETEDEESVYHSDIFAIIGTVYLWMYWPSFNGALAAEETHQQERVVINTVLSLCSSCAWTFAVSHAFENGKFDMVHIQNATLAGGVAIGSSSDLVVGPWAACFIGTIAGIISTLGYVLGTPALQKIGIYDVCGVNNLHGMPGVLGGIAGAISASFAGSEEYGANIELVFAARDTRTAGEQGGYQFLALLVTLSIAIAGGVCSSILIKTITSSDQLTPFSDEGQWNLPKKEPNEAYVPMKDLAE